MRLMNNIRRGTRSLEQIGRSKCPHARIVLVRVRYGRALLVPFFQTGSLSQRARLQIGPNWAESVQQDRWIRSTGTSLRLHPTKPPQLASGTAARAGSNELGRPFWASASGVVHGAELSCSAIVMVSVRYAYALLKGILALGRAASHFWGPRESHSNGRD